MNNPICLFDSGIGGLTVLKKLTAAFPNENYIYLADLARVPFGDKTKGEIKSIADEIISWLLKFNPKFIIMACNTSSALVLEEQRKKQNIPIYGMIESCSKEIADSKYSKITAWATKLVTKNHAYKNTVQKLNSTIQVEEISCPKLVPLIENLSTGSEEKLNVIKEYTDKISKDSEALILGCTHYPLISNDLLKLINLPILDPTDALIKELKKVINSESTIQRKTNISLYSTLGTEKMEKFVNLYLCGDYKINQVVLNKSLSAKT